MHPMNSYAIQAPARRLAELAPHVKKLANLFKVVGPFISDLHPAAKPAIESMKALAEIGADTWSRTGAAALSGLEESRHPGPADRHTLFALRRLLEEVAPVGANRCGDLYKVLTKQFHYLWLCEEHARPHFARQT